GVSRAARRGVRGSVLARREQSCRMTSPATMEEPIADTPLSLMTVHAHPDDEASTTGGILAKYAAEGVRTVLVTCTNGECGDGPNGAKPGDPDHDGAAVVALRRAELKESARILGV